MSRSPLLSVVVPVYNEQARITNGIRNLHHFLKHQDYDYELIIVNDGSNDNTLEMLHSLGKDYTFKLLSYPDNKGKGHAIKKGVSDSNGEYIAFTDIDLSTPLKELSKFLEYSIKNPKTAIVIGSRKMQGSIVVVQQPAIRKKLGAIYTLITKATLGIHVSDITCGLKLFRRDIAIIIFSVQRIDRWGIDAEILFLAETYGYAVYEIPVTWENSEQSKVNLIHDSLPSFVSIFKIRAYHLLGRYDQTS